MLTIKRHRNKSIHENGKLCFIATLLIPIITCQTFCKKLVEIPAPTFALSEKNVYSTDATAIAVLSGLYSLMNSTTTQPFQGNRSISLFAGLSSDELTLYSGVTNDIYKGYYKNALSALSPIAGSDHWAPLYKAIFRSNAAIEGLQTSNSLTPAVKSQLLGEAKFIRSFFYFYMVNLFGDIPLVVTTDYRTNTLLPRTPKEQVYQHIIEDLKEAKELLSTDYLKETLLDITTERVRPTKWAAAALLARVYLYIGDYSNAEAEATMVLNNSSLYGLTTLNEAFLKNSREAIWQIQPTAINFNTQDARTYIILPSGPSSGANPRSPAYLSNYLLNRFEIGDLRVANGNWVNSVISRGVTYFYPFKYKINASNTDINPSTGTDNMTEYFMVLRLGEQYLIRAEARAQQNNISGAQSDLDAIRTRAGLPNTTAEDKTSLMEAILHERQVELFTEWGHRWLDLKRTNQVDVVMNIITPLKANGAPWQSYQQWYPLPQRDLNTAPYLVQNPGY